MMSGMLFSTAFTMPDIICGMALTIVTMMVGSACISEINRSIPACMICGIAPSTAFIIPSIIWGIASTIAMMMSGSAATIEVRS